MKIKIMEWNIHQKGRQWDKKNKKSGDGVIPLWIIEQIPEDINIVVLTEFNSHAEEISDFYEKLEEKGFSYSSTNYSHGCANDILIAVRNNDDISVEEVSYINAYPDNPNTNFDITWDKIPENLKVYIKVNEKAFHLWGIRIKCLRNNYKERKIEMQTVMRWLEETGGKNILVGDFNNLRENTPEKDWNLSELDALLGTEFERKTPDNHSWGVSMLKNGSFDGYIKNDHLICSKGIESSVEPYVWNYLHKCNYSLEAPSGRKLVIPDREPDHGILIGEFELD